MNNPPRPKPPPGSPPPTTGRHLRGSQDKTATCLPAELSGQLRSIPLNNGEQQYYINPTEQTDLKSLAPVRVCKSNSVNCVFTITSDKVFVKIQIEDKDPLINEVIGMQYLNLAKPNNLTFLQYKGHCLLENTTNKLPAYILKANALDMTKWTAFSEFMQTADATKFPKLRIQLANTVNLLRELQVTHNDLHMNNVYVKNDTCELTIIDYGRMYVPTTKLLEKIGDITIKSLFKNYNLTTDQDFKSGTALLNEQLLENERLKYFQIRDPIGYMCDVATLVYNVIIRIPGTIRDKVWQWPTWFSPSMTPDKVRQFEFVPDGIFEYLNRRLDNPISTSRSTLSTLVLYDGLAFLALCCHVRVNFVPYIPALDEIKPDAFVKNITFDNMLTYVIHDNGTFWVDEIDNIAAAIKIVCINKFTKDVVVLQKSIFGPKPLPQQGGGELISSIKGNIFKNFDQNTPRGKDNVFGMQVRGTKIEKPDVVDWKTIKEIVGGFAPNPLVDLQIQMSEKTLDDTTPTNKLPFGNKQPPQAAGTPSHKVYTDSSTHRKYIRKNNKRVYLDQHRGKYRYTTHAKTHLRFLEKSAQKSKGAF